MSGDVQAWSVSEEQREETRRRAGSNLINIAFSRGASVSDAEASATALAIEKRAYATALAEAETTTGVRPHSETLQAYTRSVPRVTICSTVRT